MLLLMSFIIKLGFSPIFWWVYPLGIPSGINTFYYLCALLKIEVNDYV